MKKFLLQKSPAPLITIFLLIISQLCYAQKNTGFSVGTSGLKASGTFIENTGQYGTMVKGYENMGEIIFGYEGFGMPVLFTAKGLIHLQRKTERISKRAEERMEKAGVSEEEIESKKVVTDRTVIMEWVGANSNVEILKNNKTTSYSTYGLSSSKAYGYGEIIYKNVYNNIDVVYNFKEHNTEDFMYSIIVRPGGDIGKVQLKYGGDVKSIRKNKMGDIIINSTVTGIKETAPVSFYSSTKEKINFEYHIENKTVTFQTLETIDSTASYTIDPFISNTNNLAGANAGKAKDIDFDYSGNVYVTGGGDGITSYKLAKYNAAGVLQWTFNGIIGSPSWQFGINYGGWVVEKPSGMIYLGQGFANPTGFRLIRLNTNGVYDNFITTPNGSFVENWKMFWSCNNGLPQMLIAGGGINSPINLGQVSPPSTTVSSLNMTGLPGFGQDIVDMVIDPVSRDIYSLFSSFTLTPEVNNKIYKNQSPYASSSILWNIPSGFNTMVEGANRPYLVAGAGGSLQENSANILALNQNYLFYWDGKNLKAFNKASGAGVGTPLNTVNNAKWQGGLFADGCNNIFAGSTNGTIKVYNFDGNIFNDALTDIAIGGFPTKSVYDVSYDESRKLLYACGDGFVSAIDLSSYCTQPNTFTLNLTPNCGNLSVTASLFPALPLGSVATYTLFNGATQLATNSTGIFTGLSAGTNYNVLATINAACSGTQLSSAFQMPAPAFTSTVLNETCAGNNGQITVVGSGGAVPYSYSINGIDFFTSGIFSGLTAGTYNITVKDANGCLKTAPVTLTGGSGSAYSFTTANTNTSCGSTNGAITVNTTGGVLPFQFSLDNGANYQLSNSFNNLAGAVYQIKLKDATGCISTTAPITILSSTQPTVSGVSLGSSCGPSSGTITATGSGGLLPYSYSLNGGSTYQTSNVFNGVAGGTYTLTIKDANNCINISSTVLLTNIPAPDVTAIAIKATCGLSNGTINATGFAGQPPFQFSINGGATYGVSNIFNNLAAGNYNITVKDANGCTKTGGLITVENAAAPAITFRAISASCGFNNGTIHVITNGGAPAFQYSLNNGIGFQNTPTFNNLPTGNYDVLVRDANNCTATGSVSITRIPIPDNRIFVGRDTTIIINEPLQLNAFDVNNAGFKTYLWSPVYGLSNSNVKSPVATLDKEFTYYLIATTPEGCTAKDTINIKIGLNSKIFVPSAFSPNNDNHNDELKPIFIGIKTLKYFSVFNRFGELVFTTTSKNAGWDGTVKGSPQKTDAFVWMVEAVDFKGNVLFHKGTSILIR
jgi:gliding motility-associated-like protein